MITPKTHPEKYWTLEHEGHKYLVPNYIWNTLEEDVEDEILEAYKAACPDEMKDGVPDLAKYNSWRLDNRNYARTIVKTICLPVDGAPVIEGDSFDLLSSEDRKRIINFTKPPASGKKSSPTDASAISPVITP